jgi:lipopolysaccharide/colanic/teichoic acid biosynthesis glycosyltransferase
MPHSVVPITRAKRGRRAVLACKRIIDVAGSLIAILLTIPVMAAVTLALLVSDGGPVLFRQKRVGRGGKTFTILKFRTMVKDAETMLGELQGQNERQGPLFKLTHDPRVTKLGHFLRNSSIDELPQLLNVLKGDMSLVGPRPALPTETAQFGTELRDTRQRVRPGITGLWQIKARDSASFEEYERLDCEYVEALTMRRDIAILALTLPAVIGNARRRLAGPPAPVPEVATSLAQWQTTALYGRHLADAQYILTAQPQRQD